MSMTAVVAVRQTMVGESDDLSLGSCYSPHNECLRHGPAITERRSLLSISESWSQVAR